MKQNRGQNKSKYSQVFIDGGEDWILLFAFDTKMDPHVFQQVIKNKTNINSIDYNKIENIYIGNITPKKDDRIKGRFANNSLVVSGDKFVLNSPVYRILAKDDWGTVYKMLEVHEDR